MTNRQHWFILAWLAVLSTIGALGAVFGADSDVSGFIFLTPLLLLAVWGFIKFLDS